MRCHVKAMERPSSNKTSILEKRRSEEIFFCKKLVGEKSTSKRVFLSGLTVGVLLSKSKERQHEEEEHLK